MANLNVNGRTVDPKSIRQIPVPEGETPASFVQKNEGLIRKNFRDELYYESNGQLFATEDKFVIENIGIRNTSDAKLRVGAVPAVPILIDNEPDAHKVTEIEITGAGGSADWLKKELSIDKGERVNLHDLQKQADKLFASGRFLSVDFTPSATEQGVKLSLTLQEVPKEIQFQGLDTRRSQGLDALFPRPLTRENIAKGMDAVKKQLESDRGHLLRGVDFQVSGNTLQVVASTVQMPTQLSIAGATGAEAEQVRGLFAAPYTHANIEAGMGKLRDHYAQQGKILPRLEFQVQGQELKLDFATAPMPTRVAFSGMTVYKPEDVRKLFVEPLSMDHIQAGMQALQQKYQDDGYLLLAPEGVSADLTDGVLTLNVNEAKLGEIALSGNDKTKAEVIMREMRIKPGQPVNLKTLEQDVQRVSATGLFANVQHGVEADPENPGKVRVRVHTSEEKSASLNVGAGYSLSNGPFGSASLNMGNVAGMNRKVSADVTLGTKVWGGGVSYYDPVAFGKNTSLGGSLYHRQWQGPYSDETRSGAKITVGRPLGDPYTSAWRADVTVNAERIGIDERYSVSGNGVDYRMGVRPSVTYNTLDNPALPTEGTRFTAGAEPVWVSGRTIGKLDAKVEHYHPLSERFTLSGSLQGGTILGDAPLYEKYNNSAAGRTLMGWESDGKSVGSNYAIASAGINAKIWGPVSATAKLTAGDFFDGTAISPKVGAGVGVNVQIGNFGVLNAGYGLKLVGKEKGDSPGAFHIGFGIPF
ncbi:MAG: BamA/OMP85 family outer membrane protein [Candidatus Sericytochromatia bacterium]